MKHPPVTTIILTVLFFVIHLIGLLIVNHYLSIDLPYGIERPEIEPETSYLPLIIAILVATGLALLLVKLGARKIWKVWFFLVLVYTLMIAFGSVLNQNIALILAIVFAGTRLLKPGPIIQNFTELFIYGGLAALFTPIFTVLSITILLILISIYDMIAVWKTKHMISLAKFTTETNTLAGLLIPYKKGKHMQLGMLGGGDIGWTLLFSGVILKFFSMGDAIIVSAITTLALLGLFLYSKKGKYYPAMPFLTAGCLLGYLIITLI